MAQNQKMPRAFVSIEGCSLIALGNDFSLEVFAKVERNKKPISGENLMVYVNHRWWGAQPADETGRVFWRLENLRANDCLPGKQVLVEVCHKDTAGNLSKAQKVLSTDKPSTAIDPTKATKSAPPVATTLEATVSSGQLVGDKMRYYVTLVARDQFKRTIAAGRVLWNCGPESGEVDLSTGYAVHTVELAQPEVEFPYTAHSPSANIALAQQLKLSGPPKKEKKDEPETLEVIPPYCANADGTFIVKVITKKGDKPQGNVKFTLASTQPLIATSLNLTTLGKGRSLELNTSPNGTLTFVLTVMNPVQQLVIFSLPSGFSVNQMFVK